MVGHIGQPAAQHADRMPHEVAATGPLPGGVIAPLMPTASAGLDGAAMDVATTIEARTAGHATRAGHTRHSIPLGYANRRTIDSQKCETPCATRAAKGPHPSAVCEGPHPVTDTRKAPTPPARGCSRSAGAAVLGGLAEYGPQTFRGDRQAESGCDDLDDVQRDVGLDDLTDRAQDRTTLAIAATAAPMVALTEATMWMSAVTAGMVNVLCVWMKRRSVVRGRRLPGHQPRTSAATQPAPPGPSGGHAHSTLSGSDTSAQYQAQTVTCGRTCQVGHDSRRVNVVAVGTAVPKYVRRTRRPR